MRLRWARALPRGLWGVTQATRSLRQRPAGNPAWGDPHGDPGDPHGDAPGDPHGDPRGDAHGDPSGDPSGDPPGAAPRDPPGAAEFEAALSALEAAPGRRGRLELVEAALAAMPALGVARERPLYHRLLRLLPRGPWLPRGPLQRLLGPFPRQQECGLRLLEQMERHGVMPDAETRFLLLGIFGPRSRPVRKCQRLLYWLPRARHLDPHPLPPVLPPPGLPIARLALQRIASDPDARITVFQEPVPGGGGDEGSVQPFIVGAQSPDQQELLAQHSPARPVFVEGPFPIWLRSHRLQYHVLRGDPPGPSLGAEPPDPERSLYYPLSLDLDLERGPWDDDEFDVDEVLEGPVFALCVAGAGDRHTLGRWVTGLQQTNPVLGQTPVVFRLGGGDPPAAPPGLRLRAGPPQPPVLEPPPK
ncbi:hypothetical protein Q9233_017310 [Columba guinea]|nr:hypothetical protein Q9233_017310 [Columba guinea]